MESLEKEIAIAKEIAETVGLSREERVQRWKDRTKLSRATYYRRLEAARKR